MRERGHIHVIFLVVVAFIIVTCVLVNRSCSSVPADQGDENSDLQAQQSNEPSAFDPVMQDLKQAKDGIVELFKPKRKASGGGQSSGRESAEPVARSRSVDRDAPMEDELDEIEGRLKRD